MKYLNLFIVLLILVVSVPAEGPGDIVILGDFDDTFQGFSFSKGELVAVSPEAESLPEEISFIIDLPNGLGMNNTTLSDWFSGETLIFDLGDVPLAKTGARREDNFKPYLSPEQLIVGHTYLVNTGETAGYGMFRIVDLDSEKGLLSFNWIYVNN